MRHSLLSGLLLAAALLAPTSARAARSAPPGDSPEVRRRVEAFLETHREFSVGKRDLDRVAARLSHELSRASGRDARDGSSSAFDRRRAADKIADSRILEALSALNVRSRATAAGTRATVERAAPEGGPTGTSGIAGTVTDADTAVGVEGVTVSIFNSFGGFVAAAITDGNGDYETVHTLPDGTFYARALTGSTHLGELHGGLPCWLECNATQGSATVLGVGEIETGVDFALSKGGSISGTVTDGETEAGLSGVEMQVYDESDAFITTGYTDGNGDYETGFALLTGSYHVRAVSFDGYVSELYDDIECQFGCDNATGDDIAVVAGSTTTGIDFALAPGGLIRGTVTDAETKLPLEGVTVTVFLVNDAQVNSVVSGPDGTYETIASLPTGSYYLRAGGLNPYLDELYGGTHCGYECNAAAGSPVSVTGGEPTEGIDFALDLGGTISGTVSGDGNPLSGIWVGVYEADGGYVTETYTDGNGDYATPRGLIDGNYRVRTSGQGEYLDELYDDLPCFGFPGCDLTAGTDVSVTKGQTTSGIDLDLPLGGKIAGSVTDDETDSPIDVEIQVYDSSGEIVSYNYTSGGSYQTSYGMPTGTYYVRTENFAGYVDERYNDIPCVSQCDPLFGTEVDVTLGATTSGIDFALDFGGSISGTVTDVATDDPIANVSVLVYDSTGRLLETRDTDSNGDWSTFEGLPTGSYHATTRNRQQYLDELHTDTPCLACDPTDGSPISVTVGSQTEDIDFALAKGGVIAGTVTDALSGLPYPGPEFDVRVFDATGNEVDSFDAQSPDGVYATTRGLTTGTYYLTIAHNDSNSVHRGALYSGFACPFGECPPLAGTGVPVTFPDTTNDIDFVLQRRRLSADGFESDGFGAWEGGAGTGAPACDHSMCVQGTVLDPACDPCVAAIVAEDEACGDFDWMPRCVVLTYTLCGVTTCEWLAPADDD